MTRGARWGAFVLVVAGGCASSPRPAPEPAPPPARNADAVLRGDAPAPDSAAQADVERMIRQAESERASVVTVEGWVVARQDGVRRNVHGEVTTARCGTFEDVTVRKGDEVRRAVLITGCRAAPTGAPPEGSQRVLGAAALAASIAGAGATAPVRAREKSAVLESMGVLVKPAPSVAEGFERSLVLDTDTATLLPNLVKPP